MAHGYFRLLVWTGADRVAGGLRGGLKLSDFSAEEISLALEVGWDSWA